MWLRSELFAEFWNCSEEVSNQTEIGNLEDRCFFVFVDRDDDLRVFHTSEVLNRARDTNSDVKLWCNHLAGLTNLPVVRGIARVDSGARRANSRAQFVSQTFDQGKVLFGTNTATTGDNHFGRGKLWTVALFNFVLNPRRQRKDVPVS